VPTGAAVIADIECHARRFEGGRPDIIGDPNVGAPHTLSRWFNPSAFAAVPAGKIRPGNEPRGTIVGPGYFRTEADFLRN
jgi:hypothetical protein